jgi:HEAT repeat protein
VPLAPAVAARLRERAIELLTAAAGSTRPEIRANAIEALADAPRRLEPLLPRLLSDPSPAVRAVAAMAVGKAKLARFQPQLRVLVNASDPNPLARDIVRSSAIFALMRTGVDANPGVLADMLQSGEPRLRAHVAYLLGELGNPSAASLIRDASREPAPLASPPSIGLMQLQMNEALFKLGDTKAMDAVRSALYPASVEDLERTVLAAQIIGQVRAQAGRPDLNNLLARSLDPQRGAMPAEVRIAAAGGMVRLGEVRAVDVVLDYLGDPEPAVRSQAVSVVGETRQAEWLWYVQPMLDDRDPLVVVAAARAVLRLTDGGVGGG